MLRPGLKPEVLENGEPRAGVWMGERAQITAILER